jgi:ABC-type ATPase involved in cell division
MIELKNVTVTRSGTPVLSEFSMHAVRGSMTVIFGGSGSGKSTICDLILGKLDAQAGEVLVNDTDRREKIGAITPSLELLSDRSVRENVALPLEIAGASSTRRANAVGSVLDRFGLQSVADERPAALSGSMRQKAAIARAVVSEPYVLVADEPTLHLDLAASMEIADLLSKEQVRGMTVIVLTGDEVFKNQFSNATHIAL